ncbi:MAG: two-component regulator propeller domain-containing protein [Pseudomonadota bacterium]
MQKSIFARVATEAVIGGFRMAGRVLLLGLAMFSMDGAAQSAPQAGTALMPRTLLFSHVSDLEVDGSAPITAITQDQQGYIWYGTQEGLKRFDGIEIETFENRYDDPASLASDWVWAVTVARDGTLWVGTDGGGLDRFDRDSDTFVHYRHDPNNPATLSSDRIRVVYEDRAGTLWVGTEDGGLNSLDPASGAITRYRHDPDVIESLPADTVLAIREDRSGSLWIGTNGGGLSRLDRSSGRFIHFQHEPMARGSLSDNQVRAIYEDRVGRLWVGTYEGGLNLFNSESGTFRHFRHSPQDPSSLGNDRVRAIFEDRDGTLWVGTDGGLYEWRPTEQGFAPYLHDASDRSTLSDTRITSIFQDRGGVLWVGTYNGLNTWNYVSDAFTYFDVNGTGVRLSSNIVTSVEESETGELWVGTYGGGLNRIDLASSSVRYYTSTDGDGPESRLPNDRVMALYVDRSRQLWIGTRAGGLSRLDPQTNEYRHYAHDPNDASTLSSNNVTSILGDANGRLWIGTYGGGLNLLNTRSGKFTTYRHRSDDDSTIGSDRVLALYRDRDGQLWVGTEQGGLNAFDEASGTFFRINANAGVPGSLSSNTAWAIHEGRDGSLWVGTNGGGLNRWTPTDRATGQVRFSKYRKSNGLRSDTIQAILEDNAGFIWLSTNRGLVRMDPDGESVRHFSRSSGLKGSEFNNAARKRGRSGRLYFGGTSGLLGFDPSEIITNRHQPEVVVEAFDRDGPIGKRYSIRIDDPSQFELDYRDDLITFEFAGLDYAAPGKNRYRFRLEGFDDEWSETSEFRRATYTNLPAGDYTFRVQAANNDGVWNEQGVSVALKVTPPPWLTPWAYAAYALLAAGLLGAFLRAQQQKLERETTQRLELEAEVEARTEELAQRNIQLVSLNEKIKESSWTDSLTGLKNRRFLDEIVEQDVAQALRRSREMRDAPSQHETLDIAPALAFMMIDLDGFKAINDEHGHHAGDRALIQVRDVLVRCCRKSDTVIRWGGDEFLVICRNTSNRAAEKLAERIRGELAEHVFQVAEGITARLSGSIGFAVYPFSPLRPDLATWEQVSAMADQCAYIAKENGRNAWVGIYGNRETSKSDIARITSDLEGALAAGVVGLRTSVYQPLVFGGQRKAETT